MLTPAVTASLQQHLLSAGPPSTTAAAAAASMGPPRSSTVAIPRAPSGSLRHGSNSGSYNGCGGSLGEATTLGATCGSAGALNQLGAFAGFSFPGADGQLTAAMAGCDPALQQQHLHQQQQQMMMPNAWDPTTAAAAVGGSAPGSVGNLQTLLPGMAPPQDLQQQHNLLLQQQAILASSQQQLLLLQHQQQLYQQQLNGTPAAMPTLGMSHPYGSSLPGQHPQMMGMPNSLSSALHPQQGLMGLMDGTAAAQAADGTALAALGSPSSHPSATTSTLPAHIQLPSVDLAVQQQVHHQQGYLPPCASAPMRHQQQQPQLLGVLEAPTDGFFDLLSDDMLLDDAGLDLGLGASFEGAAAAAAAVAAGSTGKQHAVASSAAAAAAAGRGGSPDYDPVKEFKGFF